MTARALPALVALSLAGCQSLAGTWLFLVDPNVQASGDCAPDDDDSDIVVSYKGDSAQMVDIYELNDGSWVIQTNPILTGTLDGSTLNAEHEYSYAIEWEEDDEEYSESDVDWLEAEYDGGTLTGTVGNNYAEYARDGDDEENYGCVLKADFTAEQVTSDGNDYAGSE